MRYGGPHRGNKPLASNEAEARSRNMRREDYQRHRRAVRNRNIVAERAAKEEEANRDGSP